jgi:hypothetical protein
MSPLQRCTDIECFVWPMVLCFSAGTSPSAAEYQPQQTGSGQLEGMCASVTDGWWWTDAQLDMDLISLFSSVSQHVIWLFVVVV